MLLLVIIVFEIDFSIWGRLLEVLYICLEVEVILWCRLGGRGGWSFDL